MKRVVVTGMGLVTPLGCGLDLPWKRMLASESGIVPIDRFDTSDLQAKIAGQIPMGTADGELNLDDVMPAKDRRKVDSFIVYGCLLYTSPSPRDS